MMTQRQGWWSAVLLMVIVWAWTVLAQQSLNKWVYRIADGQVMMGLHFDPSVYPMDSTNYALLTLPESAGPPDPRTQRAVNATRLRAATVSEIAAYDMLILDEQVKAMLDRERLYSAIVWAMIDTNSPPATFDKYNAARTKIINAYRTTPWKQ